MDFLIFTFSLLALHYCPILKISWLPMWKKCFTLRKTKNLEIDIIRNHHGIHYFWRISLDFNINKKQTPECWSWEHKELCSTHGFFLYFWFWISLSYSVNNVKTIAGYFLINHRKVIAGTNNAQNLVFYVFRKFNLSSFVWIFVKIS